MRQLSAWWQQLDSQGVIQAKKNGALRLPNPRPPPQRQGQGQGVPNYRQQYRPPRQVDQETFGPRTAERVLECNYCHEFGYRLSECPSITCFICNENGHIATMGSNKKSLFCYKCGLPVVVFRICRKPSRYHKISINRHLLQEKSTSFDGNLGIAYHKAMYDRIGSKKVKPR